MKATLQQHGVAHITYKQTTKIISSHKYMARFMFGPDNSSMTHWHTTKIKLKHNFQLVSYGLTKLSGSVKSVNLIAVG